MALLDNGCQVNTVTPEFMEVHTLKAGQMGDLVTGKMCSVGLGGMHTCPLGYVIIRVQVDGEEGYDEDQIALIITGFI